MTTTIYDHNQLKIHLLENGEYQESTISPTFPEWAIANMIPRSVQQAFQEGTSKMLRTLRNQM